jgi:hypothetical protein
MKHDHEHDKEKCIKVHKRLMYWDKSPALNLEISPWGQALNAINLVML